MTKTPLTLLTEACELIEQSKTLLEVEQSKPRLEADLTLWGSSKFIVILPGGIPVRRQSARETFFEVIKRIGVEDVYELKLKIGNRRLISNEPDPDRRDEIASGRYILKATSNLQKAEILLDIAERRDVELFIIDIDKRNKLIAAWRTSRYKQIHLGDKVPKDIAALL